MDIYENNSKFNIIVGNPPFQDAYGKTNTGKITVNGKTSGGVNRLHWLLRDARVRAQCGAGAVAE